ncbi:L,D-transpeptidase family protein [Nitratireductor basaltis]|uniref:ErfK/YbiS/YcfS/YnhG family protein n=1 Tax=Nitratireductor basaltis TaxID=472175 RepID=A0A084U7J5_9HYPH|nr:murein L,D-transpeptidase family protein [Nitratireductor basaltis]KFB08931.1 ErfK/YbiS/YcfS/YnhG family protein [Nitratireductor basaltis]
MIRRLASAALMVSALVIAGCSGSLEDIAPKAERELPQKILTQMKAKGMRKDAPIMMRIFKEEGELEVWKQKTNGRYDLIASYDICKWSGKLGPKYTEGDRQAPEGFYTISPAQMNPKSQYHLAFNIGFPNAYDRANGRSGTHLMVHGACSSAGCYSMTDEQVEEIYAFARDAFRGGQQAFQLQAYPFRMTAANMARYKNDPNYPFWTMLKEGYDYFHVTKQPPKVDVCERRYVFNKVAADGARFDPVAACPPASTPQPLLTAYQSYQKAYQLDFAKATKAKRNQETKPSIYGVQEAALVADWSRKRARGERVSAEPPSLAPAPTGVSAPETMTAYSSPDTAAADVQPQSTGSTIPVSAQTGAAQNEPAEPQAAQAPEQPAALPAPNPRRFGATGNDVATPSAAQRARGAIGNLFGSQ